jgi:hypothetical protein
VPTVQVMSHITRQGTEVSNSIAMATKRDNAQMRSVATLTMVYLPLTFVAVRFSTRGYIYALIKSKSIFSMGVFNWNAEQGQSVVTIYFWIYVGVAGGLTLLTVITWLLVTLPKRRVNGTSEKEVSKLA